ncbi:P-loop NTPase [Roseomonas xinghualingensis]|uniref:P-loop NTPase n=1 Tax=Roseomonas xinghualingensis TaxID=2986475 RepID=UPI0021F1BE30|nr:P-loop NTPase [Roseomonas sp. SXEYE001]MCV4208312.1 P-loop NTPase [Roseomonas sp. SXEYE001]
MTRNSHGSHLVERAVEAMGNLDGLDMPRPASKPKPPGINDEHAQASRHEGPTPASPPAASSTHPVLSLDTLTRAGLVALPTRARGRVSEEISVVQNQVSRAMKGAVSSGSQARVALVTSARPGEGKSFTALNLAASLATSGAQPVVLVDADSKSGSLTHLLGLPDAAGLRIFADNPNLWPNDLLRPTELSQLLFMPYGAPPPNGPDMPPGAAMAAAIQRLSAALPDHAIIVDMPPCLSTSDPSTLAPIAGQVVMVVEAECTQRDELEAALDMVESCPTIQLLLNKAQLTASSTFGVYSDA